MNFFFASECIWWPGSILTLVVRLGHSPDPITKVNGRKQVKSGEGEGKGREGVNIEIRHLMCNIILITGHRQRHLVCCSIPCVKYGMLC